MISLLATRNFRMLRHNAVSLRPFHILVGQNATGKSTFLNALQFLSDVISQDVEYAVERLAPSFYDLCFDPDRPLEIAVELAVPSSNGSSQHLRYEIRVGIDEREGLRILCESLFIVPEAGRAREAEALQASLFGDDNLIVVHEKIPAKTWRKVVSKNLEGKDYFRDEKTRWNNVYRWGVTRSALGSLPQDPERFPLSISARRTLAAGVRTLALDVRKMRLASPPGGRSRIEVDGSNLPYVVRDLKRRDPVLFDDWVRTVAVAVEGLKTIEVREREDDKHLVLEARFDGQHHQPVPSWALSDGTLRLMALTLLSFAASDEEFQVFLIEEPENGLHPLAIQTVYDILERPAPSGQFLCASHSPIFLAAARLPQVLIFRRHPDGSAIVQRGDEVHDLRQWADKVNLSDLFVTGVLA
ncbi:MAG: ATP-binding protein [Acidobacteria bacterium]|nr:MAG: ATP-binding protein [Acidobacteriota bacterium]